MAEILHGTFVDPEGHFRPDLQGKTALLVPATRVGVDADGEIGSWCEAQFDDTKSLDTRYTHGWLLYPRTNFRLDEGMEWPK